MTTKEKLDKLEKMNKKCNKIQRKAFKLVGELRATEEFDSYFCKLEYATRDITEFAEWIQKEITFQQTTLLKEKK